MLADEFQCRIHRPGACRWPWITVLLAITLATLYFLYTQFTSRAQYDQMLAVAPEELNFGIAWEQSEFPWTVSIRNTSSRQLVIADFGKSCTCALIEPKTLILEPGTTHQLQLTLNLKRTTSPDSSESPFAIEIVPYERLKNSEVRALNSLRVQGRVRYAIRYLTDPVFGTHSVDSQPLYPLRILVEPLVPLANLAVTCSDSRFRVNVEHVVDERPLYVLLISAVSQLPIGPILFDVMITPEFPGGERLPVLVLPVTGRIVEDIQGSLPSVIFGSRSVGDSLEETITLTSITGQEFTVDSWEAQLPGLKVEPSTELPNSFRLRQNVLASGQQMGFVIFKLSKSGKKHAVKIPVHYHGIE